MDNEATLTGSIICLKFDSALHIKTWYSTPSISYRDDEVLVDSEEIKTQNEPDLREDHMGKETSSRTRRQMPRIEKTRS
jgi:hypothetical protein